MSAATLLGGTVAGMIVGDSLNAIPQRATVPATSSSSTPKATASGKAVSGDLTPRQNVWGAAFIVLGALALLVFGDRFLKDARIG